MTWQNRLLHGVWVHLDWDQNGPDELRLVLDAASDSGQPLDAERGLVPLPLLLGEGSIDAALQRLIASGVRKMAAHGLTQATPTANTVREAAQALAPILSLVLYLCSDEADWGADGPRNPPLKRTRRDGWRQFAATKPQTWEVGVRLGAALRRAYHSEQTGQGPEHAGPRPHIRRAHWHTILSGPRLRNDGSVIPPSDRRADLRWMPPIAVMVDDVDALPAVVRPVK